MKNLDLNKFGVQEMNAGEMRVQEGGYIDPRVYTGDWRLPTTWEERITEIIKPRILY